MMLEDFLLEENILQAFTSLENLFTWIETVTLTVGFMICETVQAPKLTWHLFLVYKMQILH